MASERIRRRIDRLLYQRKLTLPVVLGIEKDLSPSKLLADKPGKVQIALEEMGVRQAVEQQVGLAAERATMALKQLGLEAQDLIQFKELVGLVATRAV